MIHPDARLERLLGGPALAALRQRLRRHFERRSAEDPGQHLSLSQLAAAEREALALLAGRPVSTARSARIDIARIDAALRSAGVCDSLRQALERLDGPIIDRVAERQAHQQSWSAVIQQPRRDTRLHAWLQTPAAAALLKRLTRRNAAQADTLLAQADAVLRHLPTQGLARAQLAAQALGNAHALDASQPVASLVLAAWRHSENSALQAESAGAQAPTTGERVRDIWARAGVLVNELARPALALNLPPTAAGPLAPGEPCYLSLRQLLRAPPAWAVAGRAIHVCENPNLLAIAADRLGARCAPLVCTDGMPAAAQRTLLDQLTQAGAHLHYHGDFDWPGLQIANFVLRRWPAQPWRMRAEDYQTAAHQAPHRPRDLSASDTTTADWDPQLAPAMHRHGLAIAEEAVADRLIDDLRLD
ncbi:MAG: TIGR02679 family protein [Burkholderiaceae bacterium]|jgi:uncharacterized protein (TIGR02679 family)|nr:TIGR02679 family protein [Burkholderiaceae bacterium]